MTVSRPYIADNTGIHPSIPLKISKWLLPRYTSTQVSNAIKVVCVSDTHNTKPELPDGDILLHAGDLSQYGTFAEVQAQLTWLNSLPHEHKVIIAGNHDLILDENFVAKHPDRELDNPGQSRSDLVWGDIRYLQFDSVTLDIHGRDITILGTPESLKCGNFAFQDTGLGFRSRILSHKDIILAHGPPFNHLDNGKGCRDFLGFIEHIRPKLMVFGHIHEAHGKEVVVFNRKQREHDTIAAGIRPWRNLMRMLFEHDNRTIESTTLVNASVHSAKGDKQAVVVEI